MPHLRAYTAWFAFWRRGSAQVAACWCQDAAKHSAAPGFAAVASGGTQLLGYSTTWLVGLACNFPQQCLGFRFTVQCDMLCL